MTSALKPFNATYYNPSLTKDYSKVVCPPYDVISKKELLVLRKKSRYNFSNILIADKNNYKKTRIILDKWIDKKVLIDDKNESIYLYEQKFNIEGKRFKRFGILALLRMDKKGVLPHEHTLHGPKEDRRKIIQAVEANLSPIFVIANKRLKTFFKVYTEYSKKAPFSKFKDAQGNVNCVWKIQDKELIFKICGEIDKSKLVIADGHHRFEISYDYFKKNRNKFKNLNYILAYITGCQKGLNILPTHRVIHIKDKNGLFFEKLKKYFDVIEAKKSLLEKRMKRTIEFCLGIYRGGKFYFLRLKNTAILGKIGNKAYRELDTYVFHKLIIPLFESNGKIEYTHNVDEAKEKAGKNKTAFILRPASLDSVIKISSKGFRLPQKSTFFYPKVLSGIAIRRFKKRR